MLQVPEIHDTTRTVTSPERGQLLAHMVSIHLCEGIIIPKGFLSILFLRELFEGYLMFILIVELLLNNCVILVNAFVIVVNIGAMFSEVHIISKLPHTTHNTTQGTVQEVFRL